MGLAEHRRDGRAQVDLAERLEVVVVPSQLADRGGGVTSEELDGPGIERRRFRVDAGGEVVQDFLRAPVGLARFVELLVHGEDLREGAEQDRLCLPVAVHAGNHLAQLRRGLEDRCWPMDQDVGDWRDASRHQPLIAGPERVLHDPARRTRCLAELPEHDPGVHLQPRRPRQPGIVAGALEHGNSRRDGFQRPSGEAGAADELRSTGLQQLDAGDQPGVIDLRRGGACPVEHLLAVVEGPLLEKGVGKVHQELDPERRGCGQQRGGTAQEGRRRRQVTTCQGPTARRGELRRRSLADRLRTRIHEPQARPVLVCLLQVVAEDLLELQLAAALPVDALRPDDEALVECRAGALQQAPVCGVADDLVPEPVDRLVLGQLAHELLGHENAQVVGQSRPNGFIHELRDRVHRERKPDHRRRVDDRALLRLQRIEARRNECLHRRRDLQSVRAFARHPAVQAALDRTGLHEHRDHLLHVQGIALRRLRNAAAHSLVEGAQELLHDLPGVVLAQRFQLDEQCLVCLRPVGVPLGDLMPRGAEHEQRRRLDRFEEVVQEVEERRLGKVEVVDQHDDRLLRGDRLEEPAAAPHQLRDRELRGAQVHRRRDALHDPLPFVGQRRATEEQVDPPRRDPRVVVARDASRLAHDLAERPEGDALAVRQAPAPDQPGLLAGARRELTDEPRLADARVAHDRDELRLAALDGGLQRCRQAAHLHLAPHEWGGGALLLRRGGAHRHEPVRRHGLRLALEVEWRHELDFDLVPSEPVGEVAEDHFATARRLFQPRGGVHGVARDHPLGRARVARDHLAAVDPDVIAQLEARVRAESGVQRLQRRLHVRGRTDRANGVVLVPDRQPEDGHHRVADELLHRAAVALERDAHAVEVRRHDVAHRVRARGRAAQGVDLRHREHDRHRAAALAGDEGGERRAACRAEAHRVWRLLAAAGADPHPGEGRGHDCLGFAGSLVHGDEAERVDQLVRALRADRVHGLEVRSVADEVAGRLVDEHLERRRVLLHDGGGVHRRPEEHVLARLGRAEGDLAGGDAGAHDEPHAVAGFEFVVEGREGTLRFRGGLKGPEGIVIVPERQPEDRHDGVTDDLLDRAAVRFEDCAHDVEVAVQDLAERLGIQPLSERRGALEVRGDEGDDAPDFAGRLVLEERLAAHAAQAGLGRVQLPAGPAGLTLHGASLAAGAARSGSAQALAPAVPLGLRRRRSRRSP